MNKNNKNYDAVTNWSEKVPKSMFTGIKKDKNFNKHLIEPESMIGVFGSTGSGKSNWVVEFLSRKTESFCEVIIFTSIAEDPLYSLIKKTIPEAEIIDSVEKMPKLEDFKGERIDRLLIFDDTNTLSTKDQLKMKAFFEAGRKLGFTVVTLSQKFSSCPKFIRTQLKYIILFKIDDETEVDVIRRKYPMGLKKELWHKIYNYCTRKRGDFMTIDLNNNTIRQNFIGKI